MAKSDVVLGFACRDQASMSPRMLLRPQEFDDESFDLTASAYAYIIYRSDFRPNNKLHAHFRAYDSIQAEAYVATPTDLLLIESIAKPTHTPGYAFRSWKYSAAQAFLTPHGHTETTGITKNESKKVVIVSSSDSHENAFWRDHGELVGRPEDHG